MGMTKDKVIEALTALDIKFDPDAKYNVLRKVLKDATPATAKTLFQTVGKEIKKRCKKIGFVKEQVNTFADEAALVAHLNGISPNTNPDSKVQAGVKPEPAKCSDGAPEKIEFDSKMEARFMHQDRRHFDNGKLQAKLRLINRIHGTQKPVRIVTDVGCNPVQDKNDKGQTAKMLITKFTVYYK